jgi:hypothetical protein
MMITFCASTYQLWTAATLALVAALALVAIEWRRPQRQNLGTRISASIAAVVALALLGLHPAWKARRSVTARAANIRAALWTPGAGVSPPPDLNVPRGNVFALPGAVGAPPVATWYPDAATLRRRRPELTTFAVFGDGLEPAELDALRGCRVVLAAPAPDPSPRAAIRFISWPHTLALGESFLVQGNVGGLRPGSRRTLTLGTPGGAETETTTGVADAAGRANFALHADAPSAAGRFLWRVRVLPAGQSDGAEESETLGAVVAAPALPRVLMLENSPHFDTADLRHWFASAGGEFTARTLVGRDRYRYASAQADAPPEFADVDARLLARCDLVLADAAALAALKAPESEALRTAIRDGGLGLLTLVDQMPGNPPPARALFPWQCTLAGATPDDGEHLARPAWKGQAQPIATPILAAPLELTPLPGEADLIEDGQGRVLAAALQEGRGQIAVTLLHDAGRWLRANDPAAFGAYWSFLFSRLARPLSGAVGAGRWMLLGDAAGPVFVDQPVTLAWSGTAAAAASASVVAASGAPADNAVLALAREPAEPGVWQGTFWPRQPGWYRVSPPAWGAGETLDFCVDAAGSWPGLARSRRQLATARFADASADVGPSGVLAMPGKGAEAILAAGCFLLFLASAGFLWGERRFSQ